MRAEVLEVMAEEIAGRPVDALASFTTWDDGRRKLDGMARGRRWDIDREHRVFEKDTEREVRRLMKLRSRRRRPGVYRAAAQRRELRSKGRRRQLRKRRYWRNRATAIARQKITYQKHKAKRQAESLAYYRAHREEALARMRAWDRKSRPRQGKRKCSTCQRPGHNRLTCREARK